MSRSPSRSNPSGPRDVATLLATIRQCRLCAERPVGAPLPHAPRPILALSPGARLVIASQAPGNRAHESGVPFDDPSGVRLRDWMGLPPPLFYDPARVMIVPMGFCFPGYDAAKGDKPPRPECRLAWHATVFAALPQVETILLVGLHAIRYHLARLRPDLPQAAGLDATMRAWRTLWDDPRRPRLMPLPHPSWRNSVWLARNPFFAAEVLPALRAEVDRLAGPLAGPPERLNFTGRGGPADAG